ncbi:MAG: ShlB/FhaC/HecB family hemolysin secretion/activation protein [Nitrospira sp.]|nr:ShlB/FhaC/HecB family hemolysin secretion/activation protein [Nitrospira sp.]MBH0182732.1 ShlB/FhaC/HecB family hemolysin secretion/activation protein [Nitrospira sp.]MBH0184983.1 ShlB/FhaC/HecB family hemolysin secretion/activation protein [Nitrospira sp.]
MVILPVAYSAFAQTTIDPTGRSGQPQGPLKEEFQRPLPPPSPVLPIVPLQPEGREPKQPDTVRVFVREIEVIGNSVFSDAELAEVTAPFTNRTLLTEDLERLRLALTLLYVNHGYLTSGAIIPDQDVVSGIIKVHIVEGRLTRIDVEGNRWFSSSYLGDRLSLGIRTPVTLAPLQEQLQLLQQDRRIARINAELRPGEQKGESVLHVRVADKRPFRATMEVNNYQTPLVGEIRGIGKLIDNNLTGRGDQLILGYGQSSGAYPIIDVSYALPFNRYGSTFSPYYRRYGFRLIEPPFGPLNIKTNSEIIGMSLRHPIYKTVTDEVALSIIGEHLFTQSFLFHDTPSQMPFDTFPGYQNGVATVSALRFAQDWTHRTLDTVLAVRSRFSVGLNILGATINAHPDIPDGQFFSWLGQVQMIKQFGEPLLGMQLHGHINLQLTDSPLFPVEQVAAGGRYTVRGYREVTLLRDNSFIASLEPRFPLWRWGNGEPMLQLAPFVDLAHGWNRGGNRGAPTQPVSTFPDTLASVGVGLRWNILPDDRASFEVYWGQQLNHVPSSRNTIQDHGVHLGFVVNLF